MHTVGIDIGKRHHVAVILDASGQRLVRQCALPTTKLDSVSCLIGWLLQARYSSSAWKPPAIIGWRCFRR